MTDRPTLKGPGPEPPLSRADLKSILSPSPFDMNESAIETYDDVREYGIARPQSIDILRKHLRRAYRLGAAEALTALAHQGRIAIEPHDQALVVEIIHNRGTTDQQRRG